MRKALRASIEALTALGLLSLALAGLPGCKRPPPNEPRPSPTIGGGPELGEQYRKDRALVETWSVSASQPKPSEAEFSAALFRVAMYYDPYAKKRALELAGAASLSLREGAAQALGFFDDPEVVTGLGVFARKDTAASVRIRALESLGRFPGEARERELIGFLGTLEGAGADRADEKIQALASLASVTRTPSTKAGAIGELLRMDQKKALTQALNLGGEDPRIQAILKKGLKESDDPNDAADRLRRLVYLDAEWVRGRSADFVQHRFPEVRIAWLQSLSAFCPKDRWEMLNRLASREKDQRVQLAAISAVAQLGSANAAAWFTKVQHLKTWPPSAAAFHLESRSVTDACVKPKR